MTYAVYGNNNYQYGNVTRYYGDGSATNNNTLWAIEVDWTNAGVYNGENEAQYAIGLTTERGRQNMWRLGDTGNYIGQQPYMIGTAIITLDNSTDRYTRSNSSGALYGNLLPGRFVRIKATHKGVTFSIFHGKIKSIKTHNNESDKTAVIECEDGMRLLYDSDVNTGILLDKKCSELVTEIMTEIAWPSRFGYAASDLINAGYSGGMYGGAATEYTIPYWWGRAKAIDELLNIADAGAAKFVVDANGLFAFHMPAASGRIFPQDIIDTPTLDKFTFTTDKVLKTLHTPDNFDNIRTMAKIKVNPITEYAAVDIWVYGTVTPLAAGSSIDVWGEFSYNTIPCRGNNIVTPVATTDYTANAAADGSGANMTADFSVSVTVLGDNVKVTITNNAATTGYITMLKVRGDALVPENTFFVDFDNPLNTNAATYGERFVEVNSPFMQTYEKAAQSMTGWRNVLNTGRTFVFEVLGRAEMQFAPDIMSMIFFDFTDVFDSGAVWQVPFPSFSQVGWIAGYIKHEWLTPNGQDVMTSIIAEPALYNY